MWTLRRDVALVGAWRAGFPVLCFPAASFGMLGPDYTSKPNARIKCGFMELSLNTGIWV